MSSLNTRLCAESRAFLMSAASQAGEAISFLAPGQTFDLKGLMGGPP